MVRRVLMGMLFAGLVGVGVTTARDISAPVNRLTPQVMYDGGGWPTPSPIYLPKPPKK
jgi:hypothetical protein